MRLSVTDAYRNDVAGHGGPFTSLDDQWILIGSMIVQATFCRAREARRLLRQASTLAAGCFEPGEVRRLAMREWNERPRSLDVLLLLVAAVQEAGAYHLAVAIVEGLLRSPTPLTALQRGRLHTRRAQLAHRMNDFELAAAQYAALDRFGVEHGLVELRARAALGITLMTQLRGNYPEMLRSARRARRFARQAHLPALESRSAYALMVAAAQLGHDGEALVSAWEMYVAASVDPDERATSLVALGQLLLRLGQSAAAYNAFAMVIPRRASPRVLLRALSGLASAGARREAAHRAEVLWAADEVRRLRGPASPRYDLANALLECAVALDAIDETGRARVLRDEALALGEAHGFHQVVLEAEKEKQTVGTRRLPARASEVVRHFADAPAPRRPAHVRPTGAALVG